MGGYLDTAIQSLPPLQNGAAYASRSTSEQPASKTSKGVQNGEQEVGDPFFKPRAIKASLGQSSAEAMSNSTSMPLNYTFQIRGPSVGQASIDNASNRATSTSTTRPFSAGNATTQRPLGGIKTSASSHSLDGQTKLFPNTHSRRIDSPQAGPEEFDDGITEIVNEGLPEPTFDDTRADPFFFLEDQGAVGTNKHTTALGSATKQRPFGAGKIGKLS